MRPARGSDSALARGRGAFGVRPSPSLTRKAAMWVVSFCGRYLGHCRLLRGCRALIRETPSAASPWCWRARRPTMRSAGLRCRCPLPEPLGRSLLRRSLLARALGGGLLRAAPSWRSLARDLCCRLPGGWRRLPSAAADSGRPSMLHHCGDRRTRHAGRNAGTDVFFTRTELRWRDVRAIARARSRFSKMPKPVSSDLLPVATCP